MGVQLEFRIQVAGKCGKMPFCQIFGLSDNKNALKKICLCLCRLYRQFQSQQYLGLKCSALKDFGIDFVLERGQIFFGVGGEEVGKLKQTLPFNYWTFVKSICQILAFY